MKFIFAAITSIAILLFIGCVSTKSSKAVKPSKVFCKPDQPCWPTQNAWRALKSKLEGKLLIPEAPLGACRDKATSAACKKVLKELKNPYFISDHAGATQSTGWLKAWDALLSTHAVVAESSRDISLAVNFAREHNLKLVIKSTGHDYLGRSNAPDSLLIWTHKMRQVKIEDAFLPRGCPSSHKRASAVSVQAGTRWLEAYQEVTVRNGRYIQGGGCTTVGAAGGFLQGGGFGSWSKKFGTAAANLLEAEVVTADGKILIANACQNQDLFWALRGGGGGSFGIVTKATMRTYELPKYFGWLQGDIVAKSDDAFKELIEKFLHFYHDNLNNEYWGEQIKINGNNTLEFSLAFLGLNKKEAEKVWLPFNAWLEENNTKFVTKLKFIVIPGRKMWDYKYIQKNYASVIKTDQRLGEADEMFWWTDNTGEISAFWYAFQSRWIPIKLFNLARAKSFAENLFQASRHWSIALHFNKGQAGASSEAIRLGQETSINPELYNAAALAIIAASGPGFPGVPGLEPNTNEGEAKKAKVTAAMKLIRDITKGAGTYSNEADYFEPNWQTEFWGKNYDTLLAIKKKYDPDSIFTCHHCVGSED